MTTTRVPDSGDQEPPVSYDRGYSDFYTYEVIPDELLPTAKRLRVRWPSFVDYNIPRYVDGWGSFRGGSLALNKADPDVDRTLSDNHGDAMDAFSSFWKTKLKNNMSLMNSAGYTVQTALVSAALPILNYKKYALQLMNEFHGRESSMWSFINGPSDEDYENSATDLEARFAQVKSDVQQSVTQMNIAHGLLQNAHDAMEKDIKAFQSRGIATWAVTVR
jgi:hypothetical protein